MSQDQCPSTVHPGPKQKPSKQALQQQTRATANVVNGQKAWRSVDELADRAEFRDFVEREFPSGASELLSTSRRSFLQFMGASVALAGAATIPGCRRPDEKILAYSKTVPEEVIPGKPLYYATSMPVLGGGAEGLLVETHEGRPTKIEGNPHHSVNRGRSTIFAQASILSIYDPDRLKMPMFDNPARGPITATWDDFNAWAAQHYPMFERTQGLGLAVVVDKKTSPSRNNVRDAFLKRFPKATWVSYDATRSQSAIDGTAIAFGAPMHEHLSLDKAKVIAAFDRDFLASHDPASLPNARAFASTRRVEKTTDGMSRLYAIESGFSLTGGQADHRLRLKPSDVARAAVELAKFMLPKLGASALIVDRVAKIDTGSWSDAQRKFIEETAKDLIDTANRGAAVVLAGPSLPAEVHVLFAAINQSLKSLGTIVRYTPMDADLASDGRAALKNLADQMRAGNIQSVVFIGTNPVFDAPGDADFAAALKNVKASVSLSVESTETAANCTWSLNMAHWLESWGDTLSLDGTIAPVQPMIAPLYEPAKSELEMLAMLAGIKRTDGSAKDGYEIVRDSWRSAMAIKDDASFEKAWRRALHDGVVNGSVAPAASSELRIASTWLADGFAKAPWKNAGEGLEAVFQPGMLADGRFANVAWLQELPQFGTQVVWDNPALMSPATAIKLGIEPAHFSINNPNQIYTKEKYPEARVAKFTVAGKSVEAAVWVLPGMADDTVIFTVGYGRSVSGRVGDGVGFNTYPLWSASAGAAVSGVKVEKTSATHFICSTQNHWSMESRTSIVRAVDLAAWHKHGADKADDKDEFYGTGTPINFAERLGELSHTPANLSIYDNPLNRSKGDADPAAIIPGDPNGPKYQQNTKPAFLTGPQWGMTIDLSTCTGCGTCTIACQAENNIPVVGKKEVAKGREMTWIRVDRYFVGDMSKGDLENINEPAAIYHQPVACVHCENAPCETVCPVNATVHGPEGINYMVYNRCIGTRYCANNCPYKVRRFNFFDYGVTKFNGDYAGKELVEKFAPDRGGITGSGKHNLINPNLIPPRLRDKLDEISKMQKNPDVTVRSRGVMEKCTYCIQRLNFARIEAKLNDLKDADGKTFVPDGFVQTACQQACPSEAIVFGDILDKSSKVSASRASGRSYLLLGYLNTRPRTSHLVLVKNPNPALRKPVDEPFHHGGHEGGHDEGHGSHGDEHKEGGEAHTSTFYSPLRKAEDNGYAMSLNVLANNLLGVKA